VTTTTLQNLKLDIARLFAYRDEALLGFTYPMTASAGTTTTLVDTALDRGTIGASATRFNGREIDILAAAGETSRVTEGGYDGTNTLTLSPPVANVVGVNYIMWPRGLSTPLVEDEINRVLRGTEAPHVYTPSLLADADFDANDTANWPAIGTPVIAFQTTAVEQLLGERHLFIDTDTAGEGFDALLNVRVSEREQLLISAILNQIITSVNVVLYNETAASAIKTVTVDELLFTEVRFQETVPDNCEEVNLRFTCVTDGNFRVQPPIVMQSNLERLYPLPSWFTSEAQFLSAMYVPQGQASEAADSFIAQSYPWRPAERPQFVRGDRWATQHYVRLRCPGVYPIALLCKRAFPEFTAGANATTTLCDREYLTRRVAANLMDMIGPRDKDDLIRQRRWGARATTLARINGYGGRRIVLEESRVYA